MLILPAEESSTETLLPAAQPTKTPKERLMGEVLDYASSGNLGPFIENILKGSLEIEQTDARGFTAMHLAVHLNDADSIFKLLEKAGSPIDIQSTSGQTPLMLSSFKGYLPLIKLFLDRGADIEAKDSLGLSPLLHAVQGGKISAVYVLLHRGAKMDILDKNGRTAIHWAAYKNQTKMLQLFKSKGLDLFASDGSNMTALHNACMTNSIDAIEYLIFNNLSPESLDSKGRSAYAVAKDYNSEGAISAMVAASSNNPIHNYFTYLFILYWIGLYSVYYIHILPKTVHFLTPSLIFNFAAVWAISLFMVNKCFSCSTIENARDNPICNVVNQAFDSEEYAKVVRDTEICVSCEIKRPYRSKHCKYMDKCVAEYDHYCSFLGKTIGKSNRKIFVFGLMANYIAISCFVYLCWADLNESIEKFDYISTYCVNLLITANEYNGLTKCVIFLSLIAGTYTFWYCFLELYCISQALTVNEVINRHKYRYLYVPYLALDDSIKMQFKNPFTKGILTNMIEFIVN